jgi:hypothetical protein
MLAFLSSTTFVSVPTLAVMPINGNANDIITIPFDRDKTNITWWRQILYFTSQSNGTILNRVNIKTKK